MYVNLENLEITPKVQCCMIATENVKQGDVKIRLKNLFQINNKHIFFN